MASGRYRKQRLALGSRITRRQGTKRIWVRQPKMPHKKVERNTPPRLRINRDV